MTRIGVLCPGVVVQNIFTCDHRHKRSSPPPKHRCLLNPFLPFPTQGLESVAEPCGWFSASANRYNLWAHVSDGSFCWGKEPSVLSVCACMSHFCSEMLRKKGSGQQRCIFISR